MLQKIRDNNAVRLFLWPTLVALLAIAVTQGWITSDIESIVTTIGIAVLGLGGTEALRASVYSKNTVKEVVATNVDIAVENVVSKAQNVISSKIESSAVPESATPVLNQVANAIESIGATVAAHGK